MGRKSDIAGMKELERSLKLLGKVPQTIATKSARAGASIALKAAKANAPVDTGQLKSGIVLKGERKVKVGKKMYDVMMNPSMNDVFVKYGADGKRSYYPASQEYGYMTEDGGFIPGYHYLHDSIVENANAIETKIVDVAGKAVDKALSSR